MNRKIVLGLGNNIDYEIVWNSETIAALTERYGVRADELRADCVIDNMHSLLQSILGFLSQGIGGERYVTNALAIEEFSRHFTVNVTMGGTPVRAAAVISKLGYTPWLHLVSMNEHVRRLLPPGCRTICSAKEERIYPHLIVQYCKGDRIKAGDIDITASRSNRIIYVNDHDSEQMEISPELCNLLEDADIFLLSGFNAMRDQRILEQRLATLRKAMDSLPDRAQVFYEDADFHNTAFSKIVRNALLNRIHIYSMNEDELQGYLGEELDLLDTVAVSAALSRISAIIPAPVLVVHTRYWALAYGQEAGQFRDALKGGIAMAATRFQHGDAFGRPEYDATLHAPQNEKGLVFSQQINALFDGRICCLPSVRAQESGATTIGLGDAFAGGFLAALDDPKF